MGHTKQFVYISSYTLKMRNKNKSTWVKLIHFDKMHLFKLFSIFHFKSVTPKQVKAATPNLIFYTFIICRCYLKLFMKVEEIVCVQGHTKEFAIESPYTQKTGLKITQFEKVYFIKVNKLKLTQVELF